MVSMIVPAGPWTTELNWSLYTTTEGEVRASFHHHVRPKLNQNAPRHATFAPFSHLPLELQHHILSWSDIPTLFSLMHASPSTRPEALTLFWSDARTYYFVQSSKSSWIIAGGCAGQTHADLEALKYMQHIQVEF